MLLYLYLFPGPPVSPVFLCLFFGVFVVFEFLHSFGIFLRLPFCCLPFSLLGSWAVAIKASCGFRAVSVRILTSPVSASLLTPHAISSFAFSQIPSAPSPLSPPVSLLMSPLLPLSFTHIFLLYSHWLPDKWRCLKLYLLLPLVSSSCIPSNLPTLRHLLPQWQIIKIDISMHKFIQSYTVCHPHLVSFSHSI